MSAEDQAAWRRDCGPIDAALAAHPELTEEEVVRELELHGGLILTWPTT